MIEQALEQAELDWRFLTFEVDEDQLPQALDGLDVLGFRGVMLAPEFRSLAVEHLSDLTPRAAKAGAINCLVRQDGKLVGDNTFGEAFTEALGGAVSIAGRKVLVIGSSQMARTLVAAACDAKAASVHLASHDPDATAEMFAEMAANDCGTELKAMEIDDNIVVTPTGVTIVVFAPNNEEETHRPVIDTSSAGDGLAFVDTRLRGSRTGLMRFASEQGGTIIDGVDLFGRETALALERWTGISFDPAPLKELAEEFLGV